MRQEIESEHYTNPDGNPAGGHTVARGIDIHWQNGPLGRGEDRQFPNGAFVEGVIAAAIDRLEFYQRGRFVCVQNASALYHLKAALQLLEQRTAERETRGVEGTHQR